MFDEVGEHIIPIYIYDTTTMLGAHNVIPFRCHRCRGFHFAARDKRTAAAPGTCSAFESLLLLLYILLLLLFLLFFFPVVVICFVFRVFHYYLCISPSSAAAVHTTAADLLSCYCVRFVNKIYIYIYIYLIRVIRRCAVVYTRVYIFGFALWFRLTMMTMVIIIISLSLWM